MFIFRIGVLLDKKKILKGNNLTKLGVDIDGDLVYMYKGKCYKFPTANKNKTYFVNSMHNEFRRLHYIRQYLTLSSKHWVKMIQKDYGKPVVTGYIDFYTYNAIMSVYGEDKLELEEFFKSLGFIHPTQLRKTMHKYYMKETLSNMIKKK